MTGYRATPTGTAAAAIPILSRNPDDGLSCDAHRNKGTSASECRHIKISGCVLPPKAASRCFECQRVASFKNQRLRPAVVGGIQMFRAQARNHISGRAGISTPLLAGACRQGDSGRQGSRLARFGFVLGSVRRKPAQQLLKIAILLVINISLPING